MLFRRRVHAPPIERLRLALWPRRSFARSASYYRHRVLRLDASPHAIAAGVAAGAFASCTPLLGFHFLLSFALAWVIGGSMVAAALGTAVGNPLTFPVIWVSSFQLGEMLLGETPGAVSPQHLELSFSLITSSFTALWPTLKPMLFGGVLIGSALGGALYVVVRSTVLVSQAARRARVAHAARRKDREAVAPSVGVGASEAAAREAER